MLLFQEDRCGLFDRGRVFPKGLGDMGAAFRGSAIAKIRRTNSARSASSNLAALWNTIYMHAVLNQLHAEGYLVLADDVARLSPLSFKHINLLCLYAFTLSDTVSRGELRPLCRER